MSLGSPGAAPPERPVASDPVDGFGILGERHSCRLPDATIDTLWRCHECGRRWLQIGYERGFDLWRLITADEARRLLEPPSVPDDERPRRRWWHRAKQPDASLSDDPAPSRAEKITAAIVPDQLDQYLGAGECDLHDVCRDGKRQCPYHQALAAGPYPSSALPSDGA